MTFQEYKYRLGVEADKIVRANLRYDSWAVVARARQDGITFDAALATMPPENALHERERSAVPTPDNKLSPDLSPIAPFAHGSRCCEANP